MTAQMGFPQSGRDPAALVPTCQASRPQRPNLGSARPGCYRFEAMRCPSKPRPSLGTGLAAGLLLAATACAAPPSAPDPVAPKTPPTPAEQAQEGTPPPLPEPSRRGERPRMTPEQLDARMERIASDTIERMIGSEAVPQLPYDEELAAQRAAYPTARFEDVIIGSAGLKLEAWMVKPPAGVPIRGTVLGLHPWQSNRAFALKQFGFLLEHGYQLFLPDARSNLFIENADAFNAYLAEDLEDLGRIMDHLKRRDDVGPLAVYGCAWGGLEGILLAAREPRIQAVISDAGTLHYGLILVDFMNKMPPYARNDWEVVNQFIGKVTRKLEDRIGYDINRYDPRDAIGQISPRPVMVIHGADDTFVPIQVSKDVYAAAQEPKTFLEGENFGHCDGMHRAPARYIPGVVIFLERSLPEPKASGRR